MDYVYRFPVVRGIQAGSEYYIAMVPLKMLSKLFSTDEEEYIRKRLIFRYDRKIPDYFSVVGAP